MSRKKQPNSHKSSQSAGPIVLLSGAVLAVAALAGGLWLGGAFGSGASPTQTGAPGRQAPAAQAPAQPAASHSGSMASGSAAAAQPAAAMEQASSPDTNASHSDSMGAPAAAPAVAADSSGSSMSGSHDDGMSGGMGSEGDAAGSAMDSGAAAAAPAIDPADLYQVTYADHEPQALTAASEGKLGTPALVMFHADWCHVCQEVMPTVHQLREQYEGELAVVKVNVDQRDPAMAAYPVRGTPTFVIFDRFGEAVKTQRGWPGEPLMAQYLDMAVSIQ